MHNRKFREAKQRAHAYLGNSPDGHALRIVCGPCVDLNVHCTCEYVLIQVNEKFFELKTDI